jgi:SAM-dependent methyltransferase
MQEVVIDMNRMHEANRRLWNDQVAAWEERSNQEGRWHRCHKNPELAFEGEALKLIQEVFDGLENKKACIIGSGDHMAAFALAGLGAQVTSTDISEERLSMGARRAEQLGLSISFVRADAANLKPLADSSFDLVCSTNGFFVWIADLRAVFGEVARILVPGGSYVYVDIHPFQRPWKDQVDKIEVEKSYWKTGPFKPSNSESYEFNWTLADLLNPMAAAGLALVKLLESPASDTRYWHGTSVNQSSEDETSLDWRANPLAALPVWLSVAARKSVGARAEDVV